MSHDYYLSTLWEKKWQPRADAFYCAKYPEAIIKRYDTDSAHDLLYQKKDIDCSLLLPDRTIYISEKFRVKDYGDLLIEIYSKYPETTGWMHRSEAEFLAYYCGEWVYTISKYELVNWYHDRQLEVKLEDVLRHFHQNHFCKSAKQEVKIDLRHTSEVPVNLIQAFNETHGTQWHTISIAIGWHYLEKEGLNIKKWKLADSFR